MKKKSTIILAISLTFGSIAILYGVDIPGHNMLWREIGNAGHIVLFGIISIALLLLSRTILGNRFSLPITHYGISFILSSGLGFITEFLQCFTPRDADFWDIVRDMIGATVSLGILLLIERKQFPSFNMSTIKKRLLLSFIIVIFLAGISPVLIWTGGFLYRSANQPTICSFESFADKLFYKVHHGDIEIVQSDVFFPESSGNHTAKLTLHPAKYPEFYFREPFPDWSGYKAFTLSIYSPLDTAFMLSMRVEDVHHNGVYRDRFNTSLTIEPGIDEIRINCQDIKNAPEVRSMDMTRIYTFSIFAVKLKETLLFYIDDITLQ